MARDDKSKSPEESLFSFGSGDASVPGQDEGQATPPVTGRGGLTGLRRHRLGPQEGDPQEGELFDREKRDDPTGPDYGYQRRRLHRRDEVSVYTEQMDARYAMDPRKRVIVLLVVAVIVLIPLFVLTPSSWLTEDGLSNGVAGYLDVLQSNVRAFGNWVTGVPDGNGISMVFWQTLTVALIGAALALNGAVYQGALKNALASPSTLGVMSGGTLGTVIYTLVFLGSESEELVESGAVVTSASEVSATLASLDPLGYLWYTQGRALCAIVGCFAVVGLVLAIAYIAGRGSVSKSALVIAGQVFASVISGAIAVVRTYLSRYGTEAQQEAIRSMVGGSVGNIMGPFDFCLIAVPLVIGFVIVFRMSFKLNLLAFKDEEARSMGISVAFTRNTVMIVCTIMTAVVVSFCGSVGFVGFLVPHIARKIVGPDLRYLIPASALVGSVYLLIANYVMSLGTLLSSSLGTFTSLIGVVFFIVAIIQQRRRGNVDWI